MFELKQQVNVVLNDGSQITGQIIGRTIEEQPCYDVKLADGTIVPNVCLCFGDNKNYLVNAIVQRDAYLPKQ